MSTDTQPAATPNGMLWSGWVVTLLAAGALIFSGVGKFMMTPDHVKGFEHLGWDDSLALGLGILEIACAIAYVIPRTSVFGAILLTGYLGGAIATHVRVGDPFLSSRLPQLVMGMLIWFGLFLRDERLRALLPLRNDVGRSSWLTRIGFTLVTIVIGFVVVVLLQPGDFRVERSTTIAAAPADVFAQVNDFHKWDAWSPWANLDPAAQISFAGPPSGIGAVFKWSGNHQVGEGQMTLIESEPNRRIKIKLDFVKPFRDTSDEEFTFVAQGSLTKVTWSMYGKHNFISKTMCLVMNMDMEKMIGEKIDEGLASMKSTVEAPTNP